MDPSTMSKDELTYLAFGTVIRHVKRQRHRQKQYQEQEALRLLSWSAGAAHTPASDMLYSAPLRTKARTAEKDRETGRSGGGPGGDGRGGDFALKDSPWRITPEPQ